VPLQHPFWGFPSCHLPHGGGLSAGTPHCAACRDCIGAPRRGLTGRCAPRHLGGRGDILMALEAGMTVVDVSVTHPASSTTLAAAAQTDGAAADKRDKRDEAKRRAYNRLEPHG
jgi:hypothetical protein